VNIVCGFSASAVITDRAYYLTIWRSANLSFIIIIIIIMTMSKKTAKNDRVGADINH